MEEGKIDLKAWLVLGLLSLIWGTSYILIKKGLIAFSPYQVACIRLSVSFLAFVPVLIYHFQKIDWSRWSIFLLVGLTGTALPSFLFPLAQTQISSSLAGILNSLSPLFTLLLGIMIFGAVLVIRKLVGVLVGLVGATLLILLGDGGTTTGNWWYGLFVVMATICYATSANIVGFKLRDMRSLLISAVSFAFVGLPATFMLLSTDFLSVLVHHEHGWTSLGYVSVLAFFSTVIASIIFFRLIKWTTPLFASTISYLVPIVAIAWGLIDGETIHLYHLIGMSLILVGVYLSRN